jgi:FixJ family two-component response regulator
MTTAPSVFVVDDDLSVRRGLERLLRSVGYRVETFGSALDFLERGDVDEEGCLVLDIRMPGLSGFDLQQMLIARGSRLPIIFITGHGDIPMAVRAIKAGAADFLTKPFDDEALLAAIRQALSRPRRTEDSDASHPESRST